MFLDSPSMTAALLCLVAIPVLLSAEEESTSADRLLQAPTSTPADQAPADQPPTDQAPAGERPTTAASPAPARSPSATRPEPIGAGMRANPAEAFRYLDADRDGSLTQTELSEVKRWMAIFRDNPRAFVRFFRQLDANQDGRVTLTEYRQIDTLREQREGRSATKPLPTSSTGRENDEPPAATDPSTAPAASDPGSEAANLAHFEKKIRPVLVARCYSCHSLDSKELHGGLALDTREGIRRGGDSGPAIVPGQVNASLLMAAIRHERGLEMPPDSKLTAEQIADFARWIAAGAIDPREGTLTPRSTDVDPEQARSFWAFQPPVSTTPPSVADSSWPRTDVDRFVRAAQERAGVEVLGDAEPEILVRRLFFDLIGLPPSPAEIQAFVKGWQMDAEATLQSTVDQLLASQQFGERWGRHWLDVARYAESSGKETSFSYPQAWRYRDYVIDAFNTAVPFDQFIKEQLAGDLLPAENDTQLARQLIATGFLALGPKSHIERNRLQFEMDLVDEQIDTVSQAFLGLTVACARCHDHKFDPISQIDYYALAGIFRSTETLYGTIRIVQNNNPANLLSLPAGAKLKAGVPALTTVERERLEARLDQLQASRREQLQNRQAGTPELLRINIQINTLESKLRAYHEDGAPKLRAMGVRDRFIPGDSPLFIRGEIEKPGAVVPRGFVQVLCQSNTPQLGSGSGRLELANWIASADNPLTARVIVNRIWLHLFGRGLVATPDNFGLSGQRPSHPELLDYLAIKFVSDGWSVKKLIRDLVTSRVYRLDSAHHENNMSVDPDNVWLWRMSPRRLDAEAIRDAMLTIAGRLDLEAPDRSEVAAAGEGYATGLERRGQLTELMYNSRSVYLHVLRGRAFESLDLFDGVDGSMVIGQREQTTVPAQSLYLLNSPHVLSLASAAAERLLEEAREPEARIDLAYRRWFGRVPTDTERNAALHFIDRYQDQVRTRFVRPGMAEFAAWQTFCQSLWASSEFLVRR